MDKILIIEDEPAIRDILRELLTDAGYEVEEAADGLEGVEKFRARQLFAGAARPDAAQARRLRRL